MDNISKRYSEGEELHAEEFNQILDVIDNNRSEIHRLNIGKQDALTAGANIEIDSAGTISVTGIIDDSNVTSDTTFSSSKISNLLNIYVKCQKVTQEEYDALISSGTVDEMTLYIIVDPSDELHFWFFYAPDADANNVTNDTNVFSNMYTGSTSNLSGSITIDNVIYTVTKRTGDIGTDASFGTMVVPAGKVATFYTLAVSSGAAERQLDLKSSDNTYSAAVPGGSSAFNTIEVNDIAPGTYNISKHGNGNFRLGMVAVKFSITI